MAEITDLELIKMLAEQIKVRISPEMEEKALQECNDYLKNKKTNIYNMLSLSIYYIIKKLPSEEQIQFIIKNFGYIKRYDEDIFLYDMLAPASLSNFLSFRVLKEIKQIDNNLFCKILNGSSIENIINGFTEEDYMNLLNDCFEDINSIKNVKFIYLIHSHDSVCYKSTSDINEKIEYQTQNNKKFMEFILEKYKDKISSFNSKELLLFINNIQDIRLYKNFILTNKGKFNKIFETIESNELNEFLYITDSDKQEFLFFNFFESIIRQRDITKIIYSINPKFIVELYDNYKDFFDKMTLKKWIKVFTTNNFFNGKSKKILDDFDINDIEELFDTSFYIQQDFKKDVRVLKYIENKYRNKIIIDGKVESIDENTSIFSKTFFKNLKELKILLKEKRITKNTENYKKHFKNYILFLKNHNIINELDDKEFKEVEKLFYRIVMGESLSVLYEVSNIKDITLLNRIGKIDFKVDDFTVSQLESYNVKEHKLLYNSFENNMIYLPDYKKLLLKLMLLIGFKNAKYIIDIDPSISTLEHLVGNVNVKNILLDRFGNPILNEKILHLLFSNKNLLLIKEMLTNKDNELYKYFPRIFNEWESIKMNCRNKSLKNILEYLKSDDITLPPKYYRLNGLLKYIGCNDEIVKETLTLHDYMLLRFESTIPRISGNVGEYTYEILKLQDMEGISVGNRTDCCFTVLGNGYSSLKNALINKNGRILVVKKGNVLLAHSWVWRNGDLLCLDNIEISKSINNIVFLDVYIDFANKIIEKSFQEEGMDNCIKNITIGYTSFDKFIDGIEQYPCIISKTCNLEQNDFSEKIGTNRIFMDILPQPLEDVYTDSKNVQYLIKGNGKFHLGQTNYLYHDERDEIMHYSLNENYSNIYLEQMNKIVNSLRYIKYEQEGEIDSFEPLYIEDLYDVYCNNDWYIIIYHDGTIEKFVKSSDPRAKLEMDTIKIKSFLKSKKLSLSSND